MTVTTDDGKKEEIPVKNVDNGAVPDTSAKENQVGTSEVAAQTTSGIDQSTGQEASTVTEAVTQQDNTVKTVEREVEGRISEPPIIDN